MDIDNDLSHYLPIHTETFRNDTFRSFDVFFRSGEGKMVLYCARGELISDALREKLKKEHLIEKLFILKKDKTFYERYVELRLKQFLTDSSIDTPLKAKISYEAIKHIAVDLFDSPNADVIRRSKDTVLHMMDFVLDDDNAFHQLMSMTTFNQGLYNHSINVGIFSMGLTAELIKGNVDLDYSETVPAFFLHDIGKCTLPASVLQKKTSFTFLDWKLMKRHPEEGCEILRKHRALTDEAKIVVMQHHERHDGSGYPKGLSGREIHLYAKICALADIFEGLTSHRPYRKERSTYDALRIMKTELRHEFDPTLFALFVNLFRQ